MKKALVVSAASAMAAVPAWAAKPAHPSHPVHPSHPAHAQGKTHGHSNKGKSCVAHKRGYNANGTLVSGALTPGGKKDHYDGTLTVDVTRANHKAPTGSQTFTLTDARVHFGKGVTSTTLAAGDRVRLHGKITELPKRCDSTGFAPAITVHYARIRAPKQ